MASSGPRRRASDSLRFARVVGMLRSAHAMVHRPRRALATVANAVLFNAAWFAIVVTQSAPVALAVVALHLLTHFALFSRSRSEWQLIALVTAIGVIIDQLLFFLDLLNLDGRPALAPLWLSCLWPVFATTLRHACAGLEGRPWLAALLGAAGGGLSYAAGVQLSDVNVPASLAGLALLAALWALLFPFLLALSARLRNPAHQAGADNASASATAIEVRGARP